MSKKVIIAGLATFLVAATPTAASAAESGTKSLHLRKGLTVRIPTSWKVYKVGKDMTKVVTGACPTPRSRTFREVGCHSFWVMGPAMIKVGHQHFDPYTPEAPFDTASDVGLCPTDKRLWAPSGKLAAKGMRRVGRGHKAHYRAWSFLCGSPGASQKKLTDHFTQREWFLPKEKILFVDRWNTPGLSAILKNAKWS